MMYMDNDPSPLEELLGTSIAEFDIPDRIYANAIARYERLANFLADADPAIAGRIYIQGSIRLGTVTAPVDPAADYDVDLVYRSDLDKAQITKKELKERAGNALGRFLLTGPDGDPQLSEGKRCWTFDYSNEPFHMDILPAIPNADALPDGILLSDRQMFEWQSSNPIGFAEWFHRRMEPELGILREAVAKRMDIEQAPPSELKTTLQRSVQALKRHRDLYFSTDPDDRPASIIITTLAARAYSGQGSIYEVLTDITSKMANLVESRDGVLWVPNPVQPDENFADRWRDHPRRARRFFEWIQAAQFDFGSLGADSGLDRIIEKIGAALGEEPTGRAAKRLGKGMSEKRDSGRLKVGATGLLGATGIAVPRHTFHGDAPGWQRS
jgi:hypothetical protein